MQTARSTREWDVYVWRGAGHHLGTVQESCEECARCAALSKFGADANDQPGRIGPDEEFSVRVRGL